MKRNPGQSLFFFINYSRTVAVSFPLVQNERTESPSLPDPFLPHNVLYLEVISLFFFKDFEVSFLGEKKENPLGQLMPKGRLSMSDFFYPNAHPPGTSEQLTFSVPGKTRSTGVESVYARGDLRTVSLSLTPSWALQLYNI